jgi:hypothetical protein
MTREELREEIGIELELIESVLQELSSLKKDITGREPTIREKTAAAGFLAQFYIGVENVLKRISKYLAVDLPAGDTWHIDLFKRFCFPSYKTLPNLFDESLASAMAPFRKFRHVVYHAYGSQLDWERMHEGIDTIDDVFAQFKSRLSVYLQRLNN